MAHPSPARTLPDPDEGAEIPDHPVPPRTPVEDAIAEIWSDVLGRTDVGVLDDFFELGGHSLLAPRVVARIRKTLGVHIPVMDFFESPTVAALAAVVAARSTAEPQLIGRRTPDAKPVLSYDQQRLWLEDQLLPGAAYNVHGRRRLTGDLDIAALEASVRVILERHEALRTRFPTADGQPIQVVDDADPDWRLDVRDLRDSNGDRQAAAIVLADEQAATPFDLAEGPLFRCQLVRLTDTTYVLSVTMHHIISDAWSIGLFVRELSALYQAGGDAARAGLPPLPVQYRDYASWQRGWLVGERLQKQVDYWHRHLAGAPPTLALPTAQRFLSAQGGGADTIPFALTVEETTALRELCRRHGVTPFMALLATESAVLSRWSGQSDVVIGVPVARRGNADTDKLIGFLVNTLPMRVELSSAATFADLLAQVRKTSLDGYAHADAPFDMLVKDLQASRDPRRTPLFQAVLNVVGGPEVEYISGIEVEPMDEAPTMPSKFDLALIAREREGALRLELYFNADRFRVEMMRLLAEHIGTFLRAVLADPTRSILDYPLGPAPPPQEPAPVDRAAPHLAVARHARGADRVAVVDADGEWGYRWLDSAAAKVAAVLDSRGVRAGGHVAVVRRRGAAFVAALVGCLRAGATFTVTEPDSVVAARYLGAALLLDVHPDGESAPDTVELGGISAGEPPAPDDADAAEPGSDWAVERFGLTSDDRFAVLSGQPGHLMSALASAFTAGGTLVLSDGPVAGDIAGWLRDKAITVAYLSPPVLRAAGYGSDTTVPALRLALVGNNGELISHDVTALRRLAPGSRYVAAYRTRPDGLPLATYEVPANWQQETAPLRVPLGTELDGTPATLRHPSGQAAAVGEVAELCFGSQQTGDLGRRWPDGTLEFVGRLGASPLIDPVETAGALRDLPEVRDAVVTEKVGMDGETTLVGYLTGPDPAQGTNLRQQLMLRLPSFLIPSHFVVLDRLPLAADGTYDLAVLGEHDADGGAGDEYVAPRTPMERQLTDILQELLGLDRVGIHDSFFELGGFSLLATQLTTRIREQFNVELSLRDVFESPTVDELAQLIVRTQGELAGVEDLEALLDEIGPAEPERG
ncbi:condensation domain-containing protein [Solwaraspora sp. WMMB762]|uniref:condensation domain-containing protein n=1 Tax=Solwaraspora sp. WMMB762 TaxID=3404120 RepID=UPI003B9550DA